MSAGTRRRRHAISIVYLNTLRSINKETCRVGFKHAEAPGQLHQYYTMTSVFFNFKYKRILTRELATAHTSRVSIRVTEIFSQACMQDVPKIGVAGALGWGHG